MIEILKAWPDGVRLPIGSVALPKLDFENMVGRPFVEVDDDLGAIHVIFMRWNREDEFVAVYSEVDGSGLITILGKEYLGFPSLTFKRLIEDIGVDDSCVVWVQESNPIPLDVLKKRYPNKYVESE